MMGKCDNCKLRQRMARAFDFHWMGEDDCPFGCPVDAPTIIPASGGKRRNEHGRSSKRNDLR